MVKSGEMGADKQLGLRCPSGLLVSQGTIIIHRSPRIPFQITIHLGTYILEDLLWRIALHFLPSFSDI